MEKLKQEKIEKDKVKFLQPDINIGLIGHIDHGKTTLLYKLSGKWADVHSEELKRGITIKLGYANIIIRKCEKCGYLTYKENCPKCKAQTLPLRSASFIDAPGHKMLMASMLGGAAIIDAAILVIAANEPFPQPQTKEHFLAFKAKGIKDLIIVQNKIDLVSKEQALKQYYEIKEFIKKNFDKEVSIIPCSAQQEVNIDLVLNEILKLPKPERDINAIPLFLVVRSFDVNLPGSSIDDLKGAILGGTLKQGRLKVGDIIEIKPGLAVTKEVKHEKVIEYKTLKAKIISLRSNGELQEALPYGNLAIQTSLDPGLGKADRLAGSIAGLEGSLPAITKEIQFKAQLFEKLVGIEKEESISDIKPNEILLLSINTAVTVAKVVKVEKKGREFFVKANLTIPIVPFAGSNISIARNYQNQWRLIGWGSLL
ncbi:MAG: translation initiation factor IF-2 subunit gamma [Candidatus Pacearchaeota archaeon]